MKYHKLEKYISYARMDRFKIASGGNKEKSKKLYRANIRVSQAFYPILNLTKFFFTKETLTNFYPISDKIHVMLSHPMPNLRTTQFND